MSGEAVTGGAARRGDLSGRRRLARRHAAERRFRLLGAGAIVLGLAMLVVLIFSVALSGVSAFRHAQIGLDAEGMGAGGAGSARGALAALFPEAGERRARRALAGLVGARADEEVSGLLAAAQGQEGGVLWISASDHVDAFLKSGKDKSQSILSERQIGWLAALEAQGRVRFAFHSAFFTQGDSREAEYAGIRAALVGSFFTLLVTFLISFPAGLFAGIYLEELAPRNRWTSLIEVNINNLASVPSIIFGLLGLAVFLNWFGLPRSTPLVGGMVLALMTLPTIIIATRAALQSIPPSIREAALAVGASRMQSVFHHVVPLALPGILTGVIIGLAQALGETAPLLMIGMVAFIAETPGGLTDPASVLPVQIYLWADNPERAFAAKTSAAILVLLFFLVMMNAAAVFLRRRFERHW